MSIRWVLWALDETPDVTGSTDRLVLVCLAERADDSGRCFPRVGELARRTCKSEREVQRALARLEAAGYVRRQFRGRSSTVYRLRRGVPPVTQGEAGVAKGDVYVAKGDAGVTSGGDLYVTQNRHREPSLDGHSTVTSSPVVVDEPNARARAREAEKKKNNRDVTNDVPPSVTADDWGSQTPARQRRPDLTPDGWPNTEAWR